FCLVGSERLGPVVLGQAGLHRLEDGSVEGVDPLAPFGPNAPEHLRRLHAFQHVGDLVVNGRYDPLTDELTAFEELVGSHGGLGGEQNIPFLLFPAGWQIGDGRLVGAPEVHSVLRGWLEGLEGETR
ncbi:MAG: phage holin family protein, partial [Chloroflexota bacterium]|nr:phage holin family protein [Chloroflexota bacterium]